MNRFTVFYLLIVALLSGQSAFAAISIGSGFFITEDGYFVTNFHVIDGATEITLTAKGGRAIAAEIVRVDKANDLAILKAKGSFVPLPIANSRTAKRGQRVITVGYPHVDVQGFEAKVTDGIINSLSGIRDDPRVFQISVPVQSGNSGGPLVTQEGNVVGVVASKLSAVLLFKESGDFPQNVNYAIKSNYLLEILASISGLEGRLIPSNQKKFKDTEELTSIVEKSTALVLVKMEGKVAPSNIPDRNDRKPKDVQGGNTLSMDEAIERISRGDFKNDYGISIIAPDTAENGAVVPFIVKLSKPIGAGTKLLVLVNDRHLAYVAAPVKSSLISFLSGRVKMPSGMGSIRAVVIDSESGLRSSSKNLNITVGVQSFDSGEDSSERPIFRQRSFDVNGETEIKFLLNSPSSSSSYIRSVITEFSDGAVEVYLTTVASKNPYVAFKAVRPRSPGYRVTVSNNRGGSTIENGQAF